MRVLSLISQQTPNLTLRTSVSTLCETSEDALPSNTILYHLRTKFDLETLERVGNVLFQKLIRSVKIIVHLLDAQK
jgi:hypothetical protein